MSHRPGCRCAGRGGIDVHAHVVPADIPASIHLPAPPGRPSLAPAADCAHRHVMIDGAQYRTVSDRCWDVPKRISDMEAMGVAVQAISPMPELLSYWMPAAPAAELLRFLNEQMAEMIQRSGTRLLGLGAVPLQDVERAIAELHRIVAMPGFAGVEVGSNINGRPIGAPEFRPFLAEAERLGAAVFVHAIRPAGMDRLIGPAPLQQALGYPTDIGLAAASAVTGNLMLQHPRLRIAFSHGGGTFASLLPRLQQAWSVFPALERALDRSPAEQARSLFFDTLVFDDATLRHLCTTFGEDRLMIGTDYPFNFSDGAPICRIESALGYTLGSADTIDALVRKNAGRFLGLPPDDGDD